MVLWFGVFNFIYVINIGVVFSLFSNGGVFWLCWLFLIVSLGFMGFVWFGLKFDRWE